MIICAHVLVLVHKVGRENSLCSKKTSKQSESFFNKSIFLWLQEEEYNYIYLKDALYSVQGGEESSTIDFGEGKFEVETREMASYRAKNAHVGFEAPFQAV